MRRNAHPSAHQEKQENIKRRDTTAVSLADILNNVTTNETVSQLVIDPFTELEFSVYERSHTTTFSSFRCVNGHHVAALEGVDPWKTRTCVFKNLFFEPHTNQFHYFASPEEIGMFSVDELADMTSFSRSYIMNYDMKIEYTPNLVRDFYIKLVIHTEAPPQRHAVVQHPLDPAFIVYSPSYSFNLGHLIGDDGFTLFQMRETVGMSDRLSIPLFYEKRDDPYFRCSPRFNVDNRWDDCRKMMKKAYPVFMGVKTRENGDILRTLDEDPWRMQEQMLNVTMFRFPTVIAGEGGLQNIKSLQSIPQLLYRYRSWALRRLAISESQEQVQPEIVTVILPVGNSHGKQIETMQTLVPALEQRLHNHTVVIAVDMAQLSLREQALLLLRTKVLVANTGGGSMISLFMPRGSTVLLFHHKSGERHDVPFHEIGGQYKLRWMAPLVDPQSVDQAVDYVVYALSQPMVRK
jgi:hypothetical protein